MIAFVIHYALRSVTGGELPFLFIVAAWVASWYGGMGPGMATLIGGFLLADFFFLPPRYSLGQYRPEHFAPILLYLFATPVGILLIQAMHRAEGQARSAMEHERVHAKLLEREVAERVHAEEALRESEASYRALADATFDAVLIHENGIALDVNKSFCKLFGYGPEDLQGKHVVNILVDSESREVVLSYIRSGSTEVYEAKLRKKDGTQFLAELRGRNFTFKGRPVRVVSAHDITKTKQAAETLRRSEERFRTAFVGAAVGMSLMDLEGRFLEVNPRFCSVLGYTREELLNLGFRSLTHPEDLSRTLDLVRQLLSGEIPHFIVEKRYVRKDGGIVWAQSSVSPLLDAQGRPAKILAITEDISQRKRGEEGLKQSEKFLQSTLDALPSEVAILDETGTIIGVNAAWRQFADENDFPGKTHGLGLNYLDICEAAKGSWAKEAPDVARAIHQMLAGQSDKFHLEYPCHRPGQKRWFIVHLSRFETGGKLRVVATHRDVTELKQAQETLREAKEQLDLYTTELEQRVDERTADLRESIQSLEGVLYHVAHDLRAPLRAMEGFITILFQDSEPLWNATEREYARRIATAAVRMDKLIQDLLEYGRVSSVASPCVDLDLELHLNNVLERLTEVIQTKSAELQIERPLPRIYGHPKRIEEVFERLLENALKFVAPGVTPRIRIRAETGENTVRIWVQDNGIGIAPEHHQRIFRVFEHLHANEACPGTGIGLAIAAKAMERMHGQITLESKLGEGSRFCLELLPALNQRTIRAGYPPLQVR